MNVSRTSAYLGACVAAAPAAKNHDDSFAKAIKMFDDAQETEAQRSRRLRKEAQESQDRRDRDRRVQNLQSRIAALRAKRSAGGADPRRIEAEISMVETQLFWLMGGI